jgi:hypothetical protein
MAELAASPLNRERIRLWYKHDECQGERPLLLTETDGGLDMVIPGYRPRCREPWAQAQEWALLQPIVHHELIGDDWPIEPCVNVPWQITLGDFGVIPHATQPETDGTRGAYHIDAVLGDLEADFDRLHHRVFSVDRSAALARVALLDQVYDGILTVRLRGVPWWTLGVTNTAVTLIGMEKLMLAMYDQPAALHRLLAFLCDDHLMLVDWLEQEGLLTLNNENDYIGSGSRGYTRALPHIEDRSRVRDNSSGASTLSGAQRSRRALAERPSDETPSFDYARQTAPDSAQGATGRGDESPVRAADLWVLLESQETVGVGPRQYREFILPYEDRIARRFGRVYYGCCEPVHTRWQVISEIANVRRVSVSPWCDEDFMAEALGRRYVYSRKPNPTLISTRTFDEALIRADLRHTLERTKAHGCTVEVIMKDVHTLYGEPNRLTRWVQLARQAITEVYG